MDFNIQTPALIFPAISLLMLAYTNRFVVLAGLIRDLLSQHQNNPKDEILAQIDNLQKRMDLIKKMQVWGAIAFVLSALSMLAGIFKQQDISIAMFTISLVFLIISLMYLLAELSISVNALSIQLDDIKKDRIKK